MNQGRGEETADAKEAGARRRRSRRGKSGLGAGRGRRGKTGLGAGHGRRGKTGLGGEGADGAKRGSAEKEQTRQNGARRGTREARQNGARRRRGRRGKTGLGAGRGRRGKTGLGGEGADGANRGSAEKGRGAGRGRRGKTGLGGEGADGAKRGSAEKEQTRQNGARRGTREARQNGARRGKGGERATRKYGVRFIGLLGKMERDELLFSVASVQDAGTSCQRSDAMRILLSTCAMHDTTAQLTKAILSYFTSKALLDHEVQSLVNFLRSYWKVDPEVFDGVTCEQILGIVMKFIENFMAQTDFCVTQNSPNLCLIPALFYRFLKWMYWRLSKTYQESATKLPHNFVLYASKTCFLLRAFTGDALLDHVESMITGIAALFGETNPYIFPDYVADISMSRPHIVKASAETRTVSQFSFVVGALDAILTANQKEELWTLTQQILNSILRNNAVLAWRLYVIVAKRARTVVRSFIIASLTLLCGMGYESVWEINSAKETPAAACHRSRSSHHDSIAVDGFLTSARHKVQREQPFVFKKEDELFDGITENNFQFFKEPPTTNPYFMDSAIGCAIIFNQHNELFEEMTKLATGESLKGTNPVTRFFAAFPRRMVSKMSMCAIIEACDPENLGPFFEAFMPRSQFTYYIGRLVQLTDRERAETIFQLYLRELLERPWIVSGTKLWTPAERDAFMTRWMNCYEYKATFQSMLSAEMVYPKLNIKTFLMDRQIVLSFIGKNPTSFDRSLGEQFDEKLNARQLVSLNQSNLVMDIRKMASGARGILITVGNVPKIPFEAVASQVYLHFKDHTEQLEFFVDAAMPTSSSLGIFREILKQAPNNFKSRINRITVVNLSPPVGEMLNSSFPSISPEIKAKVRFSSDVEKLLQLDDHVSLPMAALRGIDERRGIIPVRVDAKDSQLIIG